MNTATAKTARTRVIRSASFVRIDRMENSFILRKLVRESPGSNNRFSCGSLCEMPSYSRRPRRAFFPAHPAGFRLVAAVFVLAAAAATAQAAKISGTVFDAGTGSRLASMRVRLYTPAGEDPGLLATTDSNGKYVLNAP